MRRHCFLQPHDTKHLLTQLAIFIHLRIRPGTSTWRPFARSGVSTIKTGPSGSARETSSDGCRKWPRQLAGDDVIFFFSRSDEHSERALSIIQQLSCIMTGMRYHIVFYICSCIIMSCDVKLDKCVLCVVDSMTAGRVCTYILHGALARDEVAHGAFRALARARAPPTILMIGQINSSVLCAYMLCTRE